MAETIRESPRIAPAAGTGAVLLMAGGLAAAFGVASCCGLPFLLATAGVSTAWLTGFALFAAPHRSFLLVAAAICLTGGAMLLWRQQRQAVCAPGALCARSAVKGLTLIGLLLGFVLLYLGYTYA
jgi:mercuric ion transport protein